MKILKWWKEIVLPDRPYAKFMIVPEQTAREDQTFFNSIVEAVKATDYSYVLYEQTDTQIERR